jgi:hypothetical protein
LAPEGAGSTTDAKFDLSKIISKDDTVAAFTSTPESPKPTCPRPVTGFSSCDVVRGAP